MAPLLVPAAVVVFVNLFQFPGALLVIAALLAAALTGFALGRAGRGRRRSREGGADADASLLTTGDDVLKDGNGRAATDGALEAKHFVGGVVKDEAFLSFMQELVASTESEAVRTTIQNHLPAMLGSRVVWITNYMDNRRQVIIPPAPNAAPATLATTDGQEWTTFALRVEQKVIGVLGVDSAVRLTPQVKRFVQLVAPVIAQAVQTAHMVESLKEAGLVDLLTGAATRREGLSRFNAELKRAQRAGGSMAVLMLDLDRFKSINDRFGHGSGDALLTAVGRTMLSTLRASDIRCRWGGEEFLIVLPDTDLTRAQVVATGLLRNIAATVVPTPAGPVSSTVSIGLTICRPGETDVDAIIRRADMALYRAKDSGRACVRVVLGDRESNPVGVGTPPPRTTPASTLPFPDRRNPFCGERRGIPSPGRRSTDPPPVGSLGKSATPAERQVPTSLP